MLSVEICDTNLVLLNANILECIFILNNSFTQALKAILDKGKKLPFPDGILINGRGPNVSSVTVQQGTLILTRLFSEI